MSANSIGTGVFGRSFGSGSTALGVLGISDNGTGVVGHGGAYGVYGTTAFGWAGYFVGDVHATGNITQGSDARLKQDVVNIDYGLREVLKLRPVAWNWKAKSGKGRQLGLIAQEVETVLPELVSTDKDAEHTKGLNYIGLVPVTIKAIQEQQAQIEEQQEQIHKQQLQIEELKLLVCLDHPQAAVCK